MWALRAVSILIGVILASCEIVTLTDDRIGLSDDSNAWNENESLVMGEIEERIERNHQTDATDERTREYLRQSEDGRIDLDSDSRGVSQRRDNMDTWLDLAAKSKELRNLPQTQRRRKKKKKMSGTTTPWIYRLGNKRGESADEAGTSVRMYRVPFNSWGGKRGSANFPALREMYDRYGRDLSVDGNDVKKKAEDIERVRGKVPFNSWGGKRSEKPSDRQPYAPVFHAYKVYKSVKGKNNGKNGDKENDNSFNRTPNHLHDESSEDASACRRRILESKKECQESVKYPDFVPWGGKRNLKPNNRFDNIVAILTYTDAGEFFCCYPIKETK